MRTAYGETELWKSWQDSAKMLVTPYSLADCVVFPPIGFIR